MTAENLPAVRPVEMLADFSADDLDVFLARLHQRWNDDPESAHALEDDLRTRVLQLVVDGHPDAWTYAKKVLETSTWTDVRRWYA